MKSAERMLEQVIADGSALKKLAEFVEAQGGDSSVVYHPERLPQAALQKEVLAPADGYISRIVCDEVGICSLILGGGRETKESRIDLSVGLVLCRKVGDMVKAGEVLAVIHANDEGKAAEAEKRFLAACSITAEPPLKTPFIKGIV